MTTIFRGRPMPWRRGAWAMLGGLLLAPHAAQAMSGPSTIEIDGGPFGELQLSGAVDGYFYVQSSTGGQSFNGPKNATGANLGNAMIELQKTTGIMQFTLEVGAYGGMPTLGAIPPRAQVNTFRASPIYMGYVTIAPPNSPFTLSAGQLSSLEGYESALDWYNPNIFASALWSVGNTQSKGISGTLTEGPLTATVTFGDGWDTGVFNFLQALVTYNFNSNNVLNLYYAGNLGRTGVNTITYGGISSGQTGAYYMNSQMFGAYYSWTRGNLNLVPEVQYVYARPDAQIGIGKYTSNFGAALFGDYAFGKSPYSLGGMVEYFTSTGQGDWFIAPHAEGVGMELTPTWQYKDLFARVSVGYLHLLNMGAYTASARSTNVVQCAFEGGLTF